MIDGMEAQILLPCRYRHARDQSRDARDGRGLPCHERLLFVELRASEERLPVQSRRAAREVLPCPVMVTALDVLRVAAADMDGGDAMFQLVDARCLCFGVSGC